MSESNTNVKAYLERAKNIETELATLREDKKELNAEMKDNGINTKDFAVALKEIMKPLDTERRSRINSYLTASGQGDLFA